MRKLIDVIYYQTYLFYSRKLNEEDPHFTTTWGVGIAFSFIIIFSLIGIKDIFICLKIKTIYLFIFSMLIYSIFYYYFTYNKRRERIVKDKPLYRNSVFKSKIVAIFYFGIAIAMMLIGPLMASHFFELNCK